MKIKLYILIGFLLSLCACAQEGPYNLGNLESTILTSFISPNEAVVKITLPDNNSFLKGVEDIYIIDRPLKPNEEIPSHYEDGVIFGKRLTEGNSKTTEFLFTNLKPATEYYVIPKYIYNVDIAPSWSYLEGTYYSGYSFSTLEEDDFSTIENSIETKSLLVGNNISIVRISSPIFSSLKDIKVTWKLEGDSSDPLNCRITSSNNYCTTVIPQELKNGDNVIFTIIGYLNNQRVEFSSKWAYNPGSGLKPECKTVFAGTDCTLIHLDIPEEIEGFISGAGCYELCKNKDFNDSDIIITYPLRNSNYFLLGNEINHSDNYYIRKKGISGMPLYTNDFSDAIIDISGIIEAATGNLHMFEIKTEESSEGMKLTLYCKEGFKFHNLNGETYLICKKTTDNSTIFKVEDTTADKVTTTLNFFINSSQVSDLKKGENYSFILGRFGMVYNEINIVTYTWADALSINWNYD